MSRTRLFFILGASGVLTVVICVAVLWVLNGHEKAARKASNQFAAALVNQDPRLGPDGATDHLYELLADYGPVKSARVVDTRNTSHGSGQSSHTYFVGDVLLETAKGPMVVALEFNGGMPWGGYDKVTDVEELAPADVPDDALSDAEFVALAKAFDARGALEAGSTRLDGVRVGSDQRTPQKPNGVSKAIRKLAKPKPPKQSPQVKRAMKQLDCVKKAKGDVEKLSRCATL